MRPLFAEQLEDRVVPGFVAPRAFDAGSRPVSAVVADFTGTGVLDLAVANDASPGTVSVLLGNGDGSFQAPRNFTVGVVGQSPSSMAVGDFNGDSVPDLAVTWFFLTVPDFGEGRGSSC